MCQWSCADTQLTYRLLVHQLGQKEADVLLLAGESSVVVLVVFLLITQREDSGQRVQLGGDVRILDVQVLSSV